MRLVRSGSLGSGELRAAVLAPQHVVLEAGLALHGPHDYAVRLVDRFAVELFGVAVRFHTYILKTVAEEIGRPCSQLFEVRARRSDLQDGLASES